MKRIILFAAMLLIGVQGFCQLNVSSRSSKLETVCSMRTGLVKVYASAKGENAIFFISIPSTNQFDETDAFYLGANKEEALQTLDDLIAFADNAEAGEMIEAEDHAKKEWMITKRVELGIPVLYFAHGIQAGLRCLMKPELVKTRKKIEVFK